MKPYIQHPNLTFDAEEHVYRWQGNKRPSVSQVLGKVGILGESGYFNPIGYGHFSKQDPEIAEFGNAFHKIAMALVLGKRVKYPESLKAWIDTFMEFSMKHKLRPVVDKNGLPIVEYPMYSVKSGYCGTPDLLAYNHRNEVCLIDWKTSRAMENHYNYQTAAYSKLVEEVHGIKVKHRIVVRFEEHKFDIMTRTNKPEDLIVFSSCLNLCKMVE